MPTICGDGLSDIWPTSLLAGAYDAHAAVSSPLSIEITENAPGDFTAMIIAVDDVLDARFVMVAVEDGYVTAWGGGQSHLPYHARLFLTAVTGDAFSITKTETLTIRKTFAIDPSWDYSRMGVACWVQKPGGSNPAPTMTIPTQNQVFQAAFAEARLTGIVEGGVEPKLAFAGASPNPFVGSSTLAFSLGEPGPVRVDLYDIAGRHVRTLIDREMPAGGHSVSWDGRGSDGAPCAAGVYLARLSSGRDVAVGKVVKLN